MTCPPRTSPDKVLDLDEGHGTNAAGCKRGSALGWLDDRSKGSYTPGGRSDDGQMSPHRELKWEITDYMPRKGMSQLVWLGKTS